MLITSNAERERHEERILRRRRWEVRICREHEGPEIVSFLREQFGEPVDLRQWRWRNFGGPGGEAIVIGAYELEGGTLIGLAGAVPQRLKIGGRQGVCYFGADTVVKKRWRYRGVHADLSQVIAREVQEAGGMLYFGMPNENAAQPIKKLGGTHLVTVPAYAKVLEWRPVCARLLGEGLFSRFVARGAPLLFGWRFRRTTGETAKTVVHFDSGFDRLWERNAALHVIAGVRNARFLRWRFASVPGRNYKIFRVGGEDLRGYAVLRVIEKFNLKIGLIVDLFCEENAQAPMESLLNAAEGYFRQQGAHVACGLFACPPNYQKTLRRQGYFRSTLKRWGRAFELVGDFVIPQQYKHYDPEAALLMQQERNWFLTLADTDLA